MANPAEELDLKVFKSVRVKVPIERAFSVFVEQMETWWPASHHIGKQPFQSIIVEPRKGGWWYERDAAGNNCNWGTVLAWEPPHMVRFSWHIGPEDNSPDWRYNPDLAKASEVEIRFIPEAAGTTLVELVHSKFERHGGDPAKLREMFDRPNAWTEIIAKFAEAFEK
jgi:uncharacterized protein YndB with AHSA1/START domain